MIYLLEDDEDIRNLVLYALKSARYEAQGFETPSALYDALTVQVPQLLLLDIMLPEEDGLSVLKKLRARPETRKLPVILLSARGTEYDKVVGLDAGADDYLAKPFGVMELLSRIRALLRRTELPEADYAVGDLYVHPEQHIVRVSGQEIALTSKEFELLCALLQAQGAVVTREQLFSQIWGYGLTVENRTLDVHIRTLRAKLGAAGQRIETVRGFGYKIAR